MSDSNKAGTISGTIAHRDAPTVPDVYITKDAQLNQLRVTLTLTLGTSPATLTPAPRIVMPDAAPAATGSLLYLDVSELGLTADQVQALDIGHPEWVCWHFDDAGIVGMTPKADLAVANGKVIELTLDGLAPDPPVRHAHLYVTQFRVVSDTSSTATLHFDLKMPPGGKADPGGLLVVSVESGGELVQSTKKYPNHQNALTLNIANKIRGATLPSATKDTSFVVAFDYATGADGDLGYGALTRPSRAKDILVTPGPGPTPWRIDPLTGVERPSWTLVPPVGRPILDGQDSVEFDIGAIVFGYDSDALPVFPIGSTVLYVRSTGIDGYADGSFVCPLKKVEHVDITSMTAPAEAVIEPGQKSAEVTISWTITGANGDPTLTTEPVVAAGVSVADIETVSDGSVNKTINQPTKFTLVASGPGVNNAAQASRTVTWPKPVIDSFTAKADPKDFGRSEVGVDIAWQVRNYDSIEIVNEPTPGPTSTSARLHTAKRDLRLIATGPGGKAHSDLHFDSARKTLEDRLTAHPWCLSIPDLWCAKESSRTESQGHVTLHEEARAEIHVRGYIEDLFLLTDGTGKHKCFGLVDGRWDWSLTWFGAHWSDGEPFDLGSREWSHAIRWTINEQTGHLEVTNPNESLFVLELTADDVLELKPGPDPSPSLRWEIMFGVGHEDLALNACLDPVVDKSLLLSLNRSDRYLGLVRWDQKPKVMFGWETKGGTSFHDFA